MSAGPDQVQAYRREAEAALQCGERDRAAVLLRGGRAAAEVLAANDPAMLRAYAGISLQLADLEAQAGRLDAVVQTLAETHARCHGLGAPACELWAAMNLLGVHLRRGDLEVASGYAASVVPLFAAVDAQGDQVIPPPDRAEVHQLLTGLAERLYYQPEDYEAAGAAAAAAVQLLPDMPAGHYWLGLALMRLGRYAEAMVTWERAIALAPDLPFLYVNYAGALAGAGRVEEAVRAMGHALELAPGEARYWRSLGDLHRQLNRHADAVADYDRVLELAAAAPEEPTAVAAGPVSQAAYERDLSLRQLAGFAAVSRLQSLQALGRTEEALRDGWQLVVDGDTAAATAARLFLGSLYESLDRRREAVEVYTQILADDRHHAAARGRRAELYLTEGMLDDAAADLAALAGQQKDAEAAIPLLIELLDRTPDHAGARKALGHAYLTAWQPAKAFTALTAALTVLPEDWELRYWRALAGVTHADEPDEAEVAWNRSFSHRRVAEAIEDLVVAATCTTDPRPSVALRWLVERAGADEQLLGWLFTETAAPGSKLLGALPELAPLPKLLHGALLGQARRWREAVDELAVARAQLADAALHVLAAQADLLLADNYLRLYEIQRTLDHLDAAEAALPLLGVPLDEACRREAKGLYERGQQRGIPNLVVDFDHVELFMLAVNDFRRRLGMLRGQALARTGDPAAAVEAMDRSGGVQQLLEDLDNQRIPLAAALGMGTILRDADRFEDALALADQLQQRADTDSLRIAVHNFAATVLQFSGDLDGAAERSRAALDLARRGTAEEVAVVAGNLAMNHVLQGEPEQALELLDANQPPPDAQQVRYAYHAIRGEALLRLGDHAGAQRELTAALAVQDEVRGRLRSYQDRMAWHARQLEVYDRAVLAATLNLDLSTALELVERSKARAFIDQLAAGHVAPTAEPHGLGEVLDRVQGRRRLLRRLSAAGHTGYVDHELLRQFAALGGSTALVERGEDGSQRLVADRLEAELAREDARADRLEAEIENARLAAAESIVGAILSPDELRDLLGGTDMGPPDHDRPD